MILETLALALGTVIGYRIGRPSRDRCGAVDFIDQVTGPDYDRRTKTVKRECRQRSDRRCVASHCTLHCRDKKRCAGECLS